MAVASDADALARFASGFDRVPEVGHAIAGTGRGLHALLAGNPTGGATELSRAEENLRAFGREYDAACVALDLARALDAAGEAQRADAARDRALPLLERLGCVNPW